MTKHYYYENGSEELRETTIREEIEEAIENSLIDSYSMYPYDGLNF